MSGSANLVDRRVALDDFGRTIRDFIRRADRSGLKASMFDVPGRTALAAEAYLRAVPAFVADTLEHIEADELGRRMRRPALRPNPMHLVGLLWLPFFRREERRLLGDDRWDESDGELGMVLDFVATALRACREDEHFVPGPGHAAMRIIDRQSAEDLARVCDEVGDAERVRLRRLAAMLELYSFMLHGEHRDGIFSHGPYELEDGRLLVVRDFTDLQNDFLAWSGPDTRVRYPTLTLALVFDEVDIEVDLWGTLHASADLWSGVRAAAIIPSVADRTPVGLDLDEVDAVTREANAAQVAIFKSVLGWPEHERSSYGVRLFANHLRNLPALVGAPDAVMGRFLERADAIAADPPPMPSPSPMWAHLAAAVDSPYTPLRQ